MPRYIINLRGRYFGWSSIVDAPFTYAMTREEMLEHAKREGRPLTGLGSDWLERLDRKGVTSRQHASAMDLIEPNQAGPNGTSLDVEGIFERYGTAPAEEG